MQRAATHWEKTLYAVAQSAHMYVSPRPTWVKFQKSDQAPHLYMYSIFGPPFLWVSSFILPGKVSSFR